MRTITAEQFLQQGRLGAPVCPLLGWVTVKVGRWFCQCHPSRFKPEQIREFVELYNAREVQMEYPGDFTALPFPGMRQRFKVVGAHEL